MRRVLPVLVGLLLLAGAFVRPALALARVTRLQTSSSADASAVTRRLPADAQAVYVIFDYESASNDKITVAIEGLGLATIVAKTSTYNGGGTATVQITGADVLHSLVSTLDAYSSQAQTDVKLAADQQLGRRGYLEAVESDVSQVVRILAVLEEMSLPAGLESQRASVAGSADQLSALVDEAMAASLDDAGQQAKAQSMKTPAAALVQSASALAEAGGTVSTIALPLTGEDAPFTVQVRVGGNPSASDEFWVVENVEGAVTERQPTGTSAASAATATSYVASRSVPTLTPITNRTQAAQTSSGAATSMPPAQAASPGSAAALVTAARVATLAAAATRGTPVALDLLNPGTPPGVLAGPPSTSGEGELASAGQPAAAEPTWTVPVAPLAGGQSPLPRSAGQAGQAPGAGGSPGPSLAVFGIGAFLLVGVAFWLRRRM